MTEDVRPDDDAEGPPDDKPMSLFDHLEELRKRLFRAILALLIGTGIAYGFSEELLAIIAKPLLDALAEGDKLVQTEVGTTFFTVLKASLVAGLFLSGPFVLAQIWGFVAPGLYPKERKSVVLYAPFSYLLFAGGAAFFYFVVQPIMLEFFIEFGRGESRLLGTTVEIANMIDVGRWFTLWLGMLRIRGIIFLLPLVMVGARMMGLVETETFTAYRRHFIVGSVIAAAVLTPTGDAITLALTMVPIVLLYEVGVLLCRVVGSGAGKEAG